MSARLMALLCVLMWAVVAGSAVLALVLAGATIGPAAAAPSSKANSFSGQCQLSGEVSFNPPLTNQPQSISQRATASGTCSGSFRDRRGATHQLSDGGLRFVETSLAENSSCAGGTANGRATLRFAYGKIHAAFHEVRAGGAVVITLTGANSGSAIAPAAVSPSENPVSILQRCASTGLDSVSLVAESSTAPSISG